jgi:endonuclease YncB( thermonuclease family)
MISFDCRRASIILRVESPPKRGPADSVIRLSLASVVPNVCLADALSLQYRCGAKAAKDLDAFIARRPVSCIPISLDQYRRTVATCSVGDIDLGEWLARNGLALDWPQYSGQKYDPAQREAEHAGRGMWAGSYVEPWLYRVCIRAGGSPSNCSDDANSHP